MTAIQARTLILAGLFAVSACIPCAAVLCAQEVTDVPVSGSQGTSVRDKVAGTISGIKSGDISAAKEAVAFDRLLSYTLIRISDCWTLCKQEMILAKECARQEAVQTAKDIFTKGKDAAMGQGREAILDALPRSPFPARTSFWTIRRPHPRPLLPPPRRAAATTRRRFASPFRTS